MNRTQWLVSSLIAVLVFAFIAFGGASLIGFGALGYAYHNLAIAKVVDGADSKIDVVKAQEDAKATKAIAEAKANNTVSTGLAENKADLKIAQSQASDALNAAKNASTDVGTLKAKLEKAQLEKDAAAAESLNEAKRELEATKELLHRKPQVILVPTAVPTACTTPVPAPVVVAPAVTEPSAPASVVMAEGPVKTIHLDSGMKPSDYNRKGVERPLAVEFTEYARKAREEGKLHPELAGKIEVTALVFDKVANGVKLNEQELRKLVQSRDGFPKGSRDYSNYERAIARNNSL